MTLEETVKILALISAYYGKAKSDAEPMAKAWHAILKDCDYAVAENAVIHFAKYDDREYGVFPSVGQIFIAIQEERKLPILLTNCAAFGDPYTSLKPIAKDVITQEQYKTLQSTVTEEDRSHIVKLPYKEALQYMRDTPKRRELNG